MIEELKKLKYYETLDSCTDKEFKKEINKIIDKVNEIVQVVNLSNNKEE
jgi:hypothetical protein